MSEYVVKIGASPADGSLDGINALISRTEQLTQIAEKNRETTKKMAQENAAAIAEESKAVVDATKVHIENKRVLEEKAKAERIAAMAMDEVLKRQASSVQLNERQKKVVEEYNRILAGTKQALSEATDPTRIKALGNEMDVVSKKIAAVYDSAANNKANAALDAMNDKLRQSGELIDELMDQKITGFASPEELEQLAEQLNTANSELDQLGVVLDFVEKKVRGMDPESELFKSLSADIETANALLGRNSEEVDITAMSWAELTDRLLYFKDQLVTEQDIKVIASLNKDIEETEAQLKRIANAGREGFDELGNKILPEVEEKTKSVESQLQALVQQLAKLRMEGKENTQQYKDLSEEAAKLRNNIKSVNDEINRSASNTQSLDTLIGTLKTIASGFALVQGAAALFGEENENVEKAILKVTSVMSILQGLQEIQIELKNKDSAASKAAAAAQGLYAFVVGNSTGALKLFRIALASTGIGLILIAIGSLVANWDKLVKIVKDSIPGLDSFGEKLDRVKQIASGVGNVIFEFMIAPIKAFLALITDGADAAVDSWNESMNFMANYTAGVNEKMLEQQKERNRKMLEENLKQYERQLKIEQAAGRDTTELERAIWSTKLALAEKGSDELKDTEAEFSAWMEKNRVKDAENARKAAEKAEAERKKEAERVAAFNKQLADLVTKREELRVEAMQEGIEKEKAAENLRFETEKQALKKQLEDFKGTGAERAKLQTAIGEAIEQAEEVHKAKLLAIDLDAALKAKKIAEEANQMLLELRKEDEDLAILAVEQKYENIRTKLKEAGQLTADVEKELTERTATETADIRLKGSQDAIKKEEELELARADLLNVAGANEKEIATNRETIKLAIQIEYAKRRLELLKASGDAENELQILQLEKVISDAQKKIEENTKKTGKTNIFQMLGIDVSDEAANKVLDSFQTVMDNIFSIFNDNIQKQINAKQRQLDELDRQISDVEKELDVELRLYEQGYANNVDAKRKEVAELKAQREKDAESLEELQKKQAEIAATQIAINGAMATASLISAAADAFKAHAKIPFVGIAIAAAAIATMFATMAAVRKQASEYQKFEKGGRIFGKRHRDGGVIIEAEDGEYMMNRDATAKYEPVLEKMNKGEDIPVYTPMSTRTVPFMLESSDKATDWDIAAKSSMMNLDSSVWGLIDGKLAKLIKLEESKKEVVDLGDRIVITSGNTTRIIHKNNNKSA